MIEKNSIILLRVSAGADIEAENLRAVREDEWPPHKLSAVNPSEILMILQARYFLRRAIDDEKAEVPFLDRRLGILARMHQARIKQVNSGERVLCGGRRSDSKRQDDDEEMHFHRNAQNRISRRWRRALKRSPTKKRRAARGQRA